MKNKALLLTALRVILGGLFLFSGLNGLFHFMEQPDMSLKARLLLEAFSMSGYLMELIKGSEIVVGALILSGKYRALSLIMAAPLLLNIVAFHLFLAPEMLIAPLILTAIAGVLAWEERKVLRPLLKP